MEPDFQSYTYDDLIQCAADINKNKYPNRYQTILQLIEEKEAERQAEKTNTIENSLNLPEDFSPKSFICKSYGSKDHIYLIRSWILIALVLITIFSVVNLSDGEIDYKLLNFGLYALAAVVYFLARLYKQHGDWSATIVFNNDHILVKRENNTQSYKLIDLVDVKSSSKNFLFNKVFRSTFHLNLVFKYGIIELGHVSPNQYEIIRYAKNYLHERLIDTNFLHGKFENL